MAKECGITGSSFAAVLFAIAVIICSFFCIMLSIFMQKLKSGADAEEYIFISTVSSFLLALSVILIVIMAVISAVSAYRICHHAESDNDPYFAVKLSCKNRQDFTEREDLKKVYSYIETDGTERTSDKRITSVTGAVPDFYDVRRFSYSLENISRGTAKRISLKLNGTVLIHSYILRRGTGMSGRVEINNFKRDEYGRYNLIFLIEFEDPSGVMHTQEIKYSGKLDAADDGRYIVSRCRTVSSGSYQSKFSEFGVHKKTD